MDLHLHRVHFLVIITIIVVVAKRVKSGVKGGLGGGAFGGGGWQGAMPPICQTLCNMTLKQHDAGVHQWHQIMPFIFTWP